MIVRQFDLVCVVMSISLSRYWGSAQARIHDYYYTQTKTYLLILILAFQFQKKKGTLHKICCIVFFCNQITSQLTDLDYLGADNFILSASSIQISQLMGQKIKHPSVLSLTHSKNTQKLDAVLCYAGQPWFASCRTTQFDWSRNMSEVEHLWPFQAAGKLCPDQITQTQCYVWNLSTWSTDMNFQCS